MSMYKNEKGFTLVELAIVLVIIGVLIGGVLKGQELITNAKVASTVSGIKGIDAAASTFQDSYGAFPGDMARAEERLSNCTAAPCENGDGNSRLDDVPNTATQDGELLRFWAHLNAADLFSGVNGTATVQWNEALPAADIGGGFVVGFTADGSIDNQTSAANGRAGHYVVLRAAPAAAADDTNALLSASEAYRIDSKMDDGAPNAGTVRAIGAAGAGVGNCADGSAPTDVYNESEDGIDCSLAIRIQG